MVSQIPEASERFCGLAEVLTSSQWSAMVIPPPVKSEVLLGLCALRNNSSSMDERPFAEVYEFPNMRTSLTEVDHVGTVVDVFELSLEE